MGRLKQKAARPSLSVGFNERIKALKLEASSRGSEIPTSSESNSVSLIGSLRRVQSGKIKKCRRKSAKHDTLTLAITDSDQTTITSTHDEGTGSNNSRSQAVPLNSLTRKQMKIQVRSKKARQFLKKEFFRKKVEILKEAEKSRLAAKARQKTVIVGDMKPILDALPEVSSVDSELQDLINKSQNDSSGSRRRKKFSMKHRDREISQGLAYFAAGLTNQ